jgi:hypothetical protein
MAFRITEYGGYASGRTGNTFAGLPSMGLGNPSMVIQTQLTTVGSSVSTMQLSPGTRFITVDTDGGAYLFIGSSASTGVASAGSSNVNVGSTGGGGVSQRIPANVAPMSFYVQPYARLCVTST